MQALRIIQEPVNGMLNIQLPSSFDYKSCEIIILPNSNNVVAYNGDEGIENTVQEPEAPYDPSVILSLRGKLKTGLTKEEIDQEIRAMRDEWKREWEE